MTRPLGSARWWIGHELRLVAREFMLDLGPAAAFVGANLLLGLYLLLHGIAFVVFAQLPASALRPGGMVDLLLAGAACLLAAVRGTATAFRMVYVRRDGEMFLAAPVSTRRLATARTLALVAAGAMLPLFWLSPFANVRALFDGPRYLAFYPVLLGLVAIVASLGALAVLQGVARFGKERLLAASRGLALMALVGMFALRIPAVEAFLRAHAGAWPMLLAAAGSVASAFSGNPVAVLGVLAAGTCCVAALPSLAADGLPPSFARLAAAPARVRAGTLLRARGLRLVAKEWRQLARERSLLGQLLSSLVLTAGAAMLLGQRLPGAGAALAGGAIVYAAGNLASDLAWLTVSGEQAPWLLASSPNAAGRLLLHKAIAAFVPAASIVLLSSAWIGSSDVAYGLRTLVSGLACCAGAVLFNVSVPTSGRRSEAVFARRSRHRLLALVDAACCACWAATAVLPPALLGWKLGAALLGAAVPVALWGSRGRFRAMA